MNVTAILQKWFGSNWEIINWLLSSTAVILAFVGILYTIVAIVLAATRNNKEEDSQKLRQTKKAKTCGWIAGGCFLFPVAWTSALLIANWVGVGKIFDDLPTALFNLLGVLWDL